MDAISLTDNTPAAHDLRTLEKLNADYVRSVEAADVEWFERHLTADFMNSNPDGTLIDKAGFLAQIGRGSSAIHLRAEDVRIRVMGDLAIIHARTTFTTRDGRSGSGRYTDIWSRRNGEWLCVAAHVTRQILNS